MASFREMVVNVPGKVWSDWRDLRKGFEKGAVTRLRS